MPLPPASFDLRGQRQLERARRHQRVLVEHLVEVAHPEEHDRVAVLTLGVEVLTHRGRGSGGRGMRVLALGSRFWLWLSAPGSRPNYYPSMVILALDTTTLRAAVRSPSMASSCWKRRATRRFRPPRGCLSI